MEDKYLKLLDEETLAFIKQTEEFYPADAVTATIDEQRQYYDALCKEFDKAYPENVTSRDAEISHSSVTIPIREYCSSDPDQSAHVIFYHGGGFILGGLDSHDSICAEICGHTGLALTAVDYRLAPEHLHPAAFEDAMAAFRTISIEQDLPIILVGDSAGGNLAAAVSHAAQGKSHAIIGQVLIYPALGADMSKGSYVEHSHAPLLTVADMEYYHDIRMPHGEPSDDASVMPLRDKNFNSVPVTVSFSAECDPLADDARLYRDRIQLAGGKAAWFNETGLVHGYLRARHSVGRAADSFTRICKAISMLANGRWDYN